MTPNHLKQSEVQDYFGLTNKAMAELMEVTHQGYMNKLSGKQYKRFTDANIALMQKNLKSKINFYLDILV